MKNSTTWGQTPQDESADLVIRDEAGLGIEWNLDADTWERAIALCSDATYFHTSAWLSTVSHTFDTRIERVRVSLPGGRWALLPLSIRPLARGLLPLACAGETGAFNGLVGPEPLEQTEVDAIYAAIRRRYKRLQIVGNPTASGAHLPAGLVGAESADASTHILKLQSLDELRRGFSRGARSRGNKARKQMLTLVVANNPLVTAEYYRLYLDSIRRWGEKLTWQRSESFYQRLMADGGAQAKIFLAYHNAVAISALLFVAHGRSTHYVAGATHADHLSTCPSNFLIEEALAYYYAAGFEIFDFGASSGLAGVIQFKESFGAKPVSYSTLEFRSPAGDVYFAVRRAVERLRAAIPRVETVLGDGGSSPALPAPLGHVS